MQFILSKIFAIFLSPSNWIFFLSALFFVIRSKTWKKRMAILVIFVVLVFSNPFLYRTATLAWQPSPVKVSGEFEVGILPGGLSGYDSSGNGYFSGAADRFIQTARLYHKGVIKYIIITGGNGHLLRDFPPEANFLLQELVANGIPADHILVDAKSRNTHENALFSKAIYDSMHFSQKAILVTSAIHMPRCQLEFTKAGLPTIAMPCDYDVLQEKNHFLSQVWPDLSLTQKWTPLLKEWIGYVLVKMR
ncbi:YdcF family protein [Flavihumibacter fluvii]|uniref:YdcF family protein n=1 Tax=Flavihumibacter fluvii TaxID=2838157 RepID=UPI001BDF13C0|nr:YdcF family protein [Flavihumibacter fluvii]ULQ52945.1 YdcF family protein [Flavihumibacter fluvii]